jgi:transposase
MKAANPSTPTQPIELAALIGLDWADQQHALTLSEAGSTQLERTTLKHTPEAIGAWVAALRQRFGGRPVGIALEQSRGALFHALSGHDCVVLYPIPPQMLKKLREAFCGSGAKDDPTDADLAWEVLAKHRDHLRPWKPDAMEVRLLDRLCEARRGLVDQRTKLVQKLGAALKQYFPQALDWAGDELSSRMACEFLLKWPTLESMQLAKPQTVRAFYYAHHCRRMDRVQARLEAMPKAVALTTDAAVIECESRRVQALARQLRALATDIDAFEGRIQELFASQPDRAIFESLPGAGAQLAPRLASAFGTDRKRYEAAEAMQTYSGVAPVLERSGKSEWVHWRWACPKYVRQTWVEFAGCSRFQSRWAAAYYQVQIERGKGHGAALRALAYKWVRIVWRCWHDGTAYSEEHYEAALRRRGSALALAKA